MSFDTNANLNRVKFAAITIVFLVLVWIRICTTELRLRIRLLFLFTETRHLLNLKLLIPSALLKDLRALHNRPYERTIAKYRTKSPQNLETILRQYF
jgi:hypothetical protein